MKNITLSAEEHLIEQVRELAQSRNTSLNAMFREWLEDTAKTKERMQKVDALLDRMEYVSVGKKFTRDEMNER